MHVFGRRFNCRQVNEINKLFGLVCYILCSKKQTSVYYKKLNQLEECIKAEINVSNDVPNKFVQGFIQGMVGCALAPPAPSSAP